MKTILIAIFVMCTFMYAQSSTPINGDEKHLTPDSVYNKDATPAQNDAAWKDGATPILSKKITTSYERWNRIDSIQATGLFFNKVTGENEIAKISIFSQKIFSWEIILYGLFFFIVMFLWTLVLKKDSNWQLGLPLVILVVSAIALVGFNFVRDVDFGETISFIDSILSWKLDIKDPALTLVLLSIFISSLASVVCFLVSDALYTEVLSRFIFFVINTILALFLFFFLIPEAKMFAISQLIAVFAISIVSAIWQGGLKIIESW